MSEMVLPALRGVFGDWVYYSCLVPMSEIAGRVDFADELQRSKRLSKLMQRELKRNRATEIKDYLLGEKERFFSSLVIAIYGGRPNWFQIGIRFLDMHDVRNAASLQEGIVRLSPEAGESLGLLRLSGREKMFAIDGQHRLAGIKEAVKEKASAGREAVSVLIVAHRQNQSGLERTRRLFTTLNKTAVPVSKSEIIALDENDAAAIIVRELVEEHPWFRGKRISFVATSNIPQGDSFSLTTIGNLYDVVKTLVLRTVPRVERNQYLRKRPDDVELKRMLDMVLGFFDGLSRRMPELRVYFRKSQVRSIVRSNRNTRGGSLVFRPIGLLTYAEVAVELSKDMPLSVAVRNVGKLPRRLQMPPIRDVLWDPRSKVVLPKNRAFLRKLFLGYVGKSSANAQSYGKVPPTHRQDVLATCLAWSLRRVKSAGMKNKHESEADLLRSHGC